MFLSNIMYQPVVSEVWSIESRQGGWDLILFYFVKILVNWREFTTPQSDLSSMLCLLHHSDISDFIWKII